MPCCRVKEYLHKVPTHSRLSRSQEVPGLTATLPLGCVVIQLALLLWSDVAIALVMHVMLRVGETCTA